MSGLSKRAAELDCALEGNVRELVDITDALLGQKATRRNIFGERETLDKTNEEVGGVHVCLFLAVLWWDSFSH